MLDNDHTEYTQSSFLLDTRIKLMINYLLQITTDSKCAICATAHAVVEGLFKEAILQTEFTLSAGC